MPKINKFGGNWTTTKLEVLNKYLSAYSTIMKEQYFKFAYIDAFAGTGYIKNKSIKYNKERLIDYDEDAREYIKGSAKIALETKPEFDKYIFIELDVKKIKELEKIIQNEHSDKLNNIEILNNDANVEICKLCSKNWQKHRAVLFLDPYGMEVKWATIKSIARTQAIDLWILFPLGVSINRLLKKNRDDIPKEWSDSLDSIFGTHKWIDEFYAKKKDETLFGVDETIIKTADFDKITQYYIKRLKGIFPHVVKTPMYLYNSKNVPIFLLCFAAGNEKGGKVAVKIAKEIMGKMLKENAKGNT